MVVTQELEEWEDSKTIGRKRQWFSIEEALSQLALHKPTQRTYLQQLRHSKHRCPNSAPPIISEHESCDDGDFTIATPKDENSTPESATAAATPTTTNDSGEMVMPEDDEAVIEERKEAEGGVSPSPAIASDEATDAASTNASPPTTPTT